MKWVDEYVPRPWVRWWRNRRRAVRHDGDFAHWSEARRRSAGYEELANLERVRRAVAAVRAGQAKMERDGMTFSEKQVSWPLLACLLHGAAQRGGRLDVIDFGGALGSTFFQLRDYLPESSLLDWRVVEQPAWVEAGQQDCREPELRFHRTLAEADKGDGSQVLLLSGVLPYLENPCMLLEEAVRRGFRAVLIDRTGVLREGERDRLTVQLVRPPLFHASYPCWFFQRRTLLAPLENNYELRDEFAALDTTNIAAEYRGFFFVRRT